MHTASGALRSWERSASSNPVIGFVDEVLRGIGQVMFQNSPITGLFFLIGLFVGSWEFGLYGVMGTAVATLTARWLGVPASLTSVGLYGFNGTLVGVALAFYLGATPMLPVYTILASIAVTIVTAAIGNIAGTWQLPALTAPFVVTTWVFALGIFQFTRLEGSSVSGPGALPTLPATGSSSLGLREIWDGFLLGPAEVFFQGKVIIGVLFLVGIFCSSRIDGAMAIAGSLIGLGTGWALGIDASISSAGLLGYNAVLTMMALGGLFYVLDLNSVILSIVAAMTSAVVWVALDTLVDPYGGHVYTAPFVITTWLFIAAKPFLHRLKAVPPADATTPEGNINLYRLKGHWWDRTSES